MKKLFLACLLIVIPTLSYGAITCETITVADSSIGFTASIITQSGWNAQYADCRLATAQVRFWTDGTAPDSSTGVIIETGEALYLDTRDDVVKFRAIRTGGTSGVLSCCYR